MSERVFDSRPITSTSRLVTALNMALNEAPEGITPSGQFSFSAVIQTDKTVLNSSEFDFEFDIPFDDDTVPNEATITIFNLSNDTVNNFKKDNELTITAGYGDDVGIVLKGKISAVKTKHSGVDKITTVYVLDNADYNDIDIVEQTFSEGAKASYILKTLLEKLKLNIAVFETQRDHTYDQDVSVKGSITEAIKKYADVCGVSVYIHKLQIYCRPIWKGDTIHFTVCSDTGMIDSPEPFEEEATYEEYKDVVTGYNIKMLFQHRMATAAIVDVESKDYKGTYRVCSGTHSFDGLSAITEIKCIENITTSIVQKEESSSSSSSSDGNSDASSSSMAEAVITKAEAEIGTAETGTNNNKYGAALGMNGVAWCGLFVAWCLKQAGFGLPKFNYASATAYAYAAAKNGWGTYHAQGSGYKPKRGDIFVRGYNGSDFNSNGHVGFVRYDSTGSTFTTVEGNSSDKVNVRTLNTASFTFVTPPYPTSGGTGNVSSGDWVKGHTATTYGYNGDDNGTCGWNGLNYHNISGCHVAIPTYCVKQASCYNSVWAKQDYPELADGYGVILEVRSPDTGKTVRAVTADSGNFGKHNKYNHNTALDLPPNTFNALGLGHGTYDIEYRVVGKVKSWNGEQV